MLDIQDLSKDFHKHSVLQHLSLHLHGQELIYIHGINGSGKSTLFKLICGILKPTSGTIEKKKVYKSVP
ncbi:ATP-binding cassette domain-containing protein [Allocoprobacillus halotolerans]|uniref:ATP-binding cassette domain-containing protein n=1 Tax=Allocoprobacillus halotolerans TaxID=2944914 RepID=A0ABY5HYA8_9FIRM|nr:ATP-binding cassette domain-containing protein [Allocoprobacillus halotolerans]UTY38034.1 ATP-binding cassette domain-containing protein [Allocoprobacillus halotolerans]